LRANSLEVSRVARHGEIEILAGLWDGREHESRGRQADQGEVDRGAGGNPRDEPLKLNLAGRESSRLES
jgi:hypothetical protein